MNWNFQSAGGFNAADTDGMPLQIIVLEVTDRYVVLAMMVPMSHGQAGVGVFRVPFYPDVLEPEEPPIELYGGNLLIQKQSDLPLYTDYASGLQQCCRNPVVVTL